MPPWPGNPSLYPMLTSRHPVPDWPKWGLSSTYKCYFQASDWLELLPVLSDWLRADHMTGPWEPWEPRGLMATAHSPRPTANQSQRSNHDPGVWPLEPRLPVTAHGREDRYSKRPTNHSMAALPGAATGAGEAKTSLPSSHLTPWLWFPSLYSSTPLQYKQRHTIIIFVIIYHQVTKTECFSLWLI